MNKSSRILAVLVIGIFLTGLSYFKSEGTVDNCPSKLAIGPNSEGTYPESNLEHHRGFPFAYYLQDHGCIDSRAPLHELSLSNDGSYSLNHWDLAGLLKDISIWCAAAAVLLIPMRWKRHE